MSRKRVELYEEVLADGRCNYRLPYTDRLTGKNKKLSIIMEKQTAQNRKEALRLLQERLDDIMMESENKNITLRALCERYFAEKERTLKKSTIIRNKATLGRLRRWMGDDVLINELTVPYVKKVILDHSEHNYTYNEYVARFKALFNWAFINGYLESRNVIDRLSKLPDDKKTRIEDKYLEKEELQALLDASADYLHWHYVIHFMALSGLRVSEVISLKDSDIDDEYIHVNSTYVINADEVGTPKTRSSVRDVFIRDELATLIKEIRKWQREERFKNGVRSDLFICDKSGDMFHYYSFNKYLKELSERTIGRVITTHALRHTATSLLIAEGVPLETVSRMLGHNDTKVTKEIYLHVTQKLRERDNEALRKVKIL